MPEIRLSSTARVIVSMPNDYLNKLAEQFSEHGAVTKTDRRRKIDLSFGSATIEADDQGLCFLAESDDETGLAYMKYAIANHVLEIVKNENPKIVWMGDGAAAGSSPPFFRQMRVVSARNISPHMRRVTLKGKDLRRFEHGGLHVHLLFPPKGIDNPQWPVTGEDGRPVWPDGDFKLVSRVYTIRNINAQRGEVDIDIVIHDGTPGSTWALNVVRGDLVGMTEPGGGDVGEADWYLLAGDETALPAIGRILERLPASAKVTACIEVDNKSDEQDLLRYCNVDILWLHRNGQQAGTTSLLQEAVEAVQFPSDGSRIFAWTGCEFSAFKAIRNFLRKERKLRREEHLVVSYWRRGFEG